MQLHFPEVPECCRAKEGGEGGEDRKWTLHLLEVLAAAPRLSDMNVTQGGAASWLRCVPVLKV